MPVPTDITTLSTTPADNQPAGTESPRGKIDDYMRQMFAFIKTLYDTKSATDHAHTGTYEPADATILKDADIGVTVAPIANPAFTGTPTGITAAHVGAVAKSGDTMTGNLNFSGNARRIIGDFSNATIANRTMFQSNVVNGVTGIGIMPNGTAQISAFTAYNSSDPSNASAASITASSTDIRIASAATGSATSLPMTFYTGGAERMRIDTSGNVLVTGSGGLGYGTGSGGTVTQATSKSTSVTLNKPSGQIAMNGAALAAGATAQFNLSNSTVSNTDVVTLSCPWHATIIPINYEIKHIVGNGVVIISVKNISAGSLSDALQINFQVHKGATS